MKSIVCTLLMMAMGAFAGGVSNVWHWTSASTNLPVVPSERWIKAETEFSQIWIDKLVDGTYRESEVKKAPTAVRCQLIGVNDVGPAWRFDYEVRMNDGSVSTNASFRAKQPRETEKITPFRPPMPDTNAVASARSRIASSTNRLHAVRQLAAAQQITNRVAMVSRKMVVREWFSSSDKSVVQWSDGSVTTNDLKRVIGKRNPAPPKTIGVPPGKHSSQWMDGYQAGVAAAGGEVVKPKAFYQIWK